MNIEDSQQKAEKFKAPLIIISVLVIVLGLLKLFGSIPLCIIECICGVILLIAGLNLSFRLTVFFEIFVVLTMIQFLWIFGQIIQIHIETGSSPLFMEFYQSIFLWTIIVTFVFDFFFVATGYEAYKAFKYLDFEKKGEKSPLIEKQDKQPSESIKSNK